MEGELIGGYRTLRHLHSGQDSQVFEVVESNSGMHRAMKIMLPEAAKVAEKRQLLFHEAEVGLKLAHPNVVKIINVNKKADSPYFVMEFFPAGSLRPRLLSKDPKDKEFLKANAEKIFKHIATGLAYMNESGWVHRDVKPDNILANALGDAKLIDFAIAYKPPTGFAKWFRRRGKGQGTRSYMSPEQIRDEVIDARADIYSFGATCYEIVTGKPPFRGASNQDLLEKHIKEKPVPPKVLNPEVTDDFNQLVMLMLNKSRDDRPRNFHEVLMKLRNMRVFKAAPAPKPAP